MTNTPPFLPSPRPGDATERARKRIRARDPTNPNALLGPLGRTQKRIRARTGWAGDAGQAGDAGRLGAAGGRDGAGGAPPRAKGARRPPGRGGSREGRAAGRPPGEPEARAAVRTEEGVARNERRTTTGGRWAQRAGGERDKTARRARDFGPGPFLVERDWTRSPWRSRRGRRGPAGSSPASQR